MTYYDLSFSSYGRIRFLALNSFIMLNFCCSVMDFHQLMILLILQVYPILGNCILYLLDLTLIKVRNTVVRIYSLFSQQQFFPSLLFSSILTIFICSHCSQSQMQLTEKCSIYLSTFHSLILYTSIFDIQQAICCCFLFCFVYCIIYWNCVNEQFLITKMFPIIDFRNGRYQGQTKNQLPNGVGIFIDKNFMFCLAEWISGQIKGYTIAIYPSGRIFCGKISFKAPEQLCSYELAQDHVQIITFAKQRRGNEIQKMAAIMPLLKIILQIDNTNPGQARVLNEYEYSITDQQSNINCVSNILNLDRNGPKVLSSSKNCIQFIQDYFVGSYPEIFQFIISQTKGKREYFVGLRGEGLGVKIQPIEELGLHLKKTGRVYLVRSMGFYSKQNQMKDIGIKTLDNVMKGIIFEQGIYNLPDTIIKYQPGKRPQNCYANFHNYIKRSLFYRDMVLHTDYIYELQNYVYGFNQNLRKIQTQKLAQYTIQNPNNNGSVLAEIEKRRREKEKENQIYIKTKDSTIDTPNPYNPSTIKVTNPEYNLQRAKDQIYRSVSKKKGGNVNSSFVDYGNIQYQDPNYRKVNRVNTGETKPEPDYYDRKLYEPYIPRDIYYEPKSQQKRLQQHDTSFNSRSNPRINGSITPIIDSKLKTSYKYLQQAEEQPKFKIYNNSMNYPSSNYISGGTRRVNIPEQPRRYNYNYTSDNHKDVDYHSPSPHRVPASVYPVSQKKNYRDEPEQQYVRNRPKYNQYDDYKEPIDNGRVGISPGKGRRRLLTDNG